MYVVSKGASEYFFAGEVDRCLLFVDRVCENDLRLGSIVVHNCVVNKISLAAPTEFACFVISFLPPHTSVNIYSFGLGKRLVGAVAILIAYHFGALPRDR